MGYKVKWVEDHLGVSRKALRLFEEYDLMPYSYNAIREYSEEDLDRIWAIKTFQGMGYTLREISEMVKNPDFDMRESIAGKVEELRLRVKDAERDLGYAEAIKITGIIPNRPVELGTITWKEFRAKTIDIWNTQTNPEIKAMSGMVEVLLDDPSERRDSQLMAFFDVLENVGLTVDKYKELLYLDQVQREIMKRMELGVNHPEVQLLVKLVHDAFLNIFEDIPNMTHRQFARYYSRSIMEGDCGELQRRQYGVNEMKFFADAIAIFGGYESYEEVL